jgi:hypothetical protein
MNYLGLTVFAGKTPGIILDFNRESKDYTIEFVDGRIVTTSVVNWQSSIPAEPEVAKYRLANRNNGETLVFGDQGWDVISGDQHFSIENRWPHTDRLIAPGYRYSVDMEGGSINLYAPDGHRIGSLSNHTAPALGNEADALWDAAQWLLMAPGGGHGVDEDSWDEHGEEHLEWLNENASNMDDILLDFAEAAAAQGSEEARAYAGIDDSDSGHIARTATDYWETGGAHEISQGEDADEDHMRSDTGGNSDIRHTEKELFNNTKDEEGNPEQDFPDGKDATIVPPVPADVERFMERAETAEPDPMKTDREFPSGEYNERSRIPSQKSYSHIREQAEWEDKHYANNPVCEDCGDPLVNGTCYSCCAAKKGVSPEEYGKNETDTVIRQANVKTAGPLLALAPIAEAVGGALGMGAAEAGAAGAAGAAEGAAGGSMLGNIGSLVGKAYRPLMVGNAIDNLTGGGNDSGDGGGQAPPAQYQSIVATTEADSEIYAYKNRGDNSNPDIGGTGGYNETHGDGPEYMKDVDDVGGTIAVIRRFTDSGDIDGAIDHAMSVLAEGIPAVIQYADSEESGKGVKEIDDLNELLEAAFGEDYTKHRDADDKRTSKVITADGPPGSMAICQTCGNNVTIGQQYCSENPPRLDCPTVKMAHPGATPSSQQQPAPQQAVSPVTQAPGGAAYAQNGTLDFPVYPKVTRALKISARRPKMCPYHTELTDYALALSDPSAALSALSQHLYSDKSCKGEWGVEEGKKCRFKPEMVHNEYWEQKEQEAAERKQQREQNLVAEQTMEEVQDALVTEEVEVESSPVDTEYAIEAEITEDVVIDVALDNATNIGEESSPYNDYIPAENYSDFGSATDNGSYESAPMGEAVMASARDWLKTAEEHEDKEDVRVYEYPGDEHYEEGSASGDRIEDTDGNELEPGQTYRIGPEDQIPDVVKVVSVDPQYIEVRRIDSTFPENENNRPYRLTLKEMMVQDIKIEKTGDQVNPAEIGGGTSDSLMGTPETNNDAGAGQQDTHGTTDLSTGQYSSSHRLARRDYSPNEQRSFVNEHGAARNLEKLDLEGTHYPDEMENSSDDYFLWG